MKVVGEERETHVGFVWGKSKLSPQPPSSIPRLELCATVLAVEMAELIQEELDVNIDSVSVYTDGKVVLGYIYQAGAFMSMFTTGYNGFMSVQYLNSGTMCVTEYNPADYASRSVSASKLAQTTWFTGPGFLIQTTSSDSASPFVQLGGTRFGLSQNSSSGDELCYTTLE